MDPLGLAVIAAVLVVALTMGLLRRRTDGAIRDEAAEKRRRRSMLEEAGLELAPERDKSPAARAAKAAAAASTAAAAAVHRAHDPAPPDKTDVIVHDEIEEPGVVEQSSDRLDPALLERLGVGPAGATILQFSSAFCAPCRAVRRVSAEVAAVLPGAQHIEVDAESHLGEVRELGIWRTPTVLLLDAGGRVVKRATGVPSKPQLAAAVAEILSAS